MSIFVDTNILIYSIDQSQPGLAKRVIAENLLNTANLVMSVQVLNEFVHQATRSSRTGRISHDTALLLVSSWRRFPVLDLTLRLFDATAEIRQETGYSWWDSLIVAAAISAGCETLATEDLQHGRTIHGLRLANPFIDMA